MNEAYSKVLKRLWEYRKKMNLSQREISETIGLTQSHFSKIERYEKILSLDSLIKLNENGVDMDFLITGIETDKSILDDLFKKCPDSHKEEFLNVMFLYVNSALISLGDEKILDYEKELTILRFNFSQRIHYNNKTVWHCLRQLSGVTQEKFANELNIGLKYYREIEKLQSSPNVETLVLLYEKYGYYPSLVSTEKANYLLTLNKIWPSLSTELQTGIQTMLEANLKFFTDLK